MYYNSGAPTLSRYSMMAWFTGKYARAIIRGVSPFPVLPPKSAPISTKYLTIYKRYMKNKTRRIIVYTSYLLKYVQLNEL